MSAKTCFKDFADVVYEQEGVKVCVFCCDKSDYTLHDLPCGHQACSPCICNERTRARRQEVALVCCGVSFESRVTDFIQFKKQSHAEERNSTDTEAAGKGANLIERAKARILNALLDLEHSKEQNGKARSFFGSACAEIRYRVSSYADTLARIVFRDGPWKAYKRCQTFYHWLRNYLNPTIAQIRKRTTASNQQENSPGEQELEQAAKVLSSAKRGQTTLEQQKRAQEIVGEKEASSARTKPASKVCTGSQQQQRNTQEIAKKERVKKDVIHALFGGAFIGTAVVLAPASFAGVVAVGGVGAAAGYIMGSKEGKTESTVVGGLSAATVGGGIACLAGAPVLVVAAPAVALVAALGWCCFKFW